MAKFTIKGKNLDDAKFYIDDQPVEFVGSLNLSMTAGEMPRVIIEFYCTDGVDIELPDVVVEAAIKNAALEGSLIDNAIARIRQQQTRDTERNLQWGGA